MAKASLRKPTRASVWAGYRISGDGGVNNETDADCACAGTDTFVADTSLFGASDMKSAVTQLRRIVSKAVPH
jgi:pentose-5-phosphate-3-epimerase